MKKFIALFMALLIVASLAACGSSQSDKKDDTKPASSAAENAQETKTTESKVSSEEAEENESYVPWPSGGLFDMLPKPVSNDVIITYEGDTYISVEVHHTTQEDYTAYVEQLKAKGFTEKEDAQHAEHVFDATNAEGYELMSSVASVSEIMYLQLSAP